MKLDPDVPTPAVFDHVITAIPGEINLSGSIRRLAPLRSLRWGSHSATNSRWW